MNNQTIELKFGTPTPIYYNDPNYGKIQFLIRGIFKCNAVDQNINVDEINNVIVTNANVWISEVIQQNQNVEYEKLSEITKNYLSQKVVTVLPNNLQFVGLDKFELNLTNESLAIVNSKKVTVVDTAKCRESETCFLWGWYMIYEIDRSQYSRFGLTNWRDAIAIY